MKIDTQQTHHIHTVSNFYLLVSDYFDHYYYFLTGKGRTTMNYSVCIVFLLLFPLASVHSFSTLPRVGTIERRRSYFSRICNEKKRTVSEYYDSPRKLSPILGMNNNSNNKNNKNDHSNRLILLCRRLQLIIRGYGPAFLLGYVFIDCLYSGYAVWRYKQIRYVSILGFIMGLRPVQQQIIQPVIIKIATKSVTVVSLTYLKLHALKIVLAMLQIPLWNILMERANRQWLWSKRRFVVVVGSAVTVALTLFGSAMLR